MLKADAFVVAIGVFREDKPMGIVVSSADITVNGHVVGWVEGNTDRGYYFFPIDEFADVPVPGGYVASLAETLADVRAGFDHAWEHTWDHMN